MNEERLYELQEEQSGILSLKNTLIFAKWAFVVIASLALTIMLFNFIQANLFYSSYAGIGIVFFSFAALIDAAIIRIKIWLSDIESEIAELIRRRKEYE